MASEAGRRLSSPRYSKRSRSEGPTSGSDPASHLAAVAGSSVAISALVARGADVNAKDGVGADAFDVRRALGRTAAVKTLLQHGADPASRHESWTCSLALRMIKGATTPQSSIAVPCAAQGATRSPRGTRYSSVQEAAQAAQQVGRPKCCRGGPTPSRIRANTGGDEKSSGFPLWSGTREAYGTPARSARGANRDCARVARCQSRHQSGHTC